MRFVLLAALLFALPAAVHASSARVSVCATPLTLKLHPHPAPGRPATAPPMPAGTIALAVPLYPGATRTSLPMPQAAIGEPESWYRKQARAKFLARASQDRVESWYQVALTGCGFHASGSSTSGNRGGVVSSGFTYTAPQSASWSLQVAFESAPRGGTLVLYLATAIVPPRPQTLAAGSPESLTVQVYPGLGAAQSPVSTSTTTDRTRIARIVHDLNRLPVSDLVFSCPMDDGSHDLLTFRYANGSMLAVRVGLRGCQIVTTRGRSARATPRLLRDLSALRQA